MGFGAVLAGTGIGWGLGAARADTMDDVFTRVIDQRGITHGSRADLIAAGHAVCDYQDQGHTAVQTALWVQSNSGLTPYDSGFFVGAAEAAFCAWNAPASARGVTVSAHMGAVLR